jgi:hypothetical protein
VTEDAAERDGESDEVGAATYRQVAADDVETDVQADAEADVDGEQSGVDQLFARLKAGRSDDEPEPGAAADGTSAEAGHITEADDAAGRTEDTDDHDEAEPVDPDTALLLARDEGLEAIERELGKRLKRVLADEQNEVFDLLRRDKPAGLDDVVPAAPAHADRYAQAALSGLQTAAGEGASVVDGKVTASCTALAVDLGQSLVEPMRERIARSFDDCGGDLEEVTERLR